MPNDLASAPGTGGPFRIQTSTGAVHIATDAERRLAYDTLHYAPARQAGDTLYVSGVIVDRLPGEGDGVEEFKAQVRRAFREIGQTLVAAGTGFEHVALVNSFHVWDSPNLRGDKRAHVEAFASVKDEFLKEPYPAWTAVGTTALITDGLVEIQIVAKIPAFR